MYVDSTLCDDNDVRYDSIFQKRTLRQSLIMKKVVALKKDIFLNCEQFSLFRDHNSMQDEK